MESQAKGNVVNPFLKKENSGCANGIDSIPKSLSEFFRARLTACRATLIWDVRPSFFCRTSPVSWIFKIIIFYAAYTILLYLHKWFSNKIGKNAFSSSNMKHLNTIFTAGENSCCVLGHARYADPVHILYCISATAHAYAIYACINTVHAPNLALPQCTHTLSPNTVYTFENMWQKIFATYFF
jgi:hypothetical protein